MFGKYDMSGASAVSMFMGFAQEFVVVMVFFVSYVVWRQRRDKSSNNSKRATTVGRRATDKPVPAAVGKCPRQHASIAGAGATTRASVRNDATIESEKLMLQHLEHLEFTRALNLYRSCEKRHTDLFSEDLYYAFIQSAIRVGKIDVVDRMLNAMKRNGVVPDTRFWQRVLKMLSSRKYYSACLAAQDVFENQIPCDKVIYSCLINAALEAGQAARASAMLEPYGASGVDTKDFVLFFRTYVATNDVDATEKVFRKLGAATTPLMLNLLLLCCVNAKDPPRALRILHDAHALEASDNGAFIVDIVSYNTVMKGFAQIGQLDACFQCLQDMLSRSLEPDDITLGLLLDACIGSSKLALADELIDLLLNREKQSSTVMCTLFIKGLVRANRLPRALQLYEEMRRRENGHMPDVVTYSILVKALVDQSDLERALQLIADMRQAGLMPDDIILTHILDGCRHTGNHEVGKQLFKQLIDAGVAPSDFTLVSMLKLHGRCGAHDEAFDLVRTWKAKHNIDPSVIHYTCIMSGCLRSKKYEKAWEAYELMVSSGIEPDATTINTLLPVLSVGQQWQRAVQLARRGLEATPPMKIPPETLNSVLAAMLSGGSSAASFAFQLQAAMRRADVPVTARNARRT